MPSEENLTATQPLVISAEVDPNDAKDHGVVHQKYHQRLGNPHTAFFVLLAVSTLSLLFQRMQTHATSLYDNGNCEQLLQSGRWWAFQGVEHASWQPCGCVMKQYDRFDTTQCLSQVNVSVIGDSITRLFYTALVKKLGHSTDGLFNDENKHMDHQMPVSEGMQTYLFWDPFLNRSLIRPVLDGSTAMPTTVIINTGRWHIRNMERDAGIAVWTQRLQDIADEISRASQSGNWRVYLVPLSAVEYEKLAETRRSITNEVIDVYNSKLKHAYSYILAKNPELKQRVFLPDATRKMFVDNDESVDGLHYTQAIYDAEVDVLLNHLCNSHAPVSSPSKIDTTCCNSYPLPNWKQVLILIALCFISFGSLLLRSVSTNPVLDAYLPSYKNAKSLSIFVGCVMLLYFADRTGFYLKQAKHFEAPSFTVLMLAIVIIGLLTLETNNNTNYLNRHQTDEWKGWMQIVILVYHYTGASKVIPIYNVMRVLVASYLFMTGFGHFIFFYKKSDFSLARICKVLVRLNLLTVALAYVMNQTYQIYYFSPLVTIWYFVIRLIMRIQSEKNKDWRFLLGKILIATVLISLLLASKSVFSIVVTAAALLTGTVWDGGEWHFRMALDRYIVFGGMLFAFAFLKLSEHIPTLSIERAQQLNMFGLFAGTLGMLWYFSFELSFAEKVLYNTYHPYISIVPVVSFVILRNATESARKTTSALYAFFGRISLETFIVQFHFWLAMDTRGLLVVFPGESAAIWWLNFIVVSGMFVYVSWMLAKVTGDLSDWFIGETSADQNAQLLRKLMYVSVGMVVFNHLPA